jgi:DNA-binding LacI/PurR family transcriptional regulator
MLREVNSSRSDRATIFQVAEAAGVSITTVSHVFSGKRRVGAETRRRVLGTADRLSYTPSSSAMALATGRSYALALQVSFTGEALLLNTFFGSLLPSISLAAVESGYGFAFVPPAEEGRSFIDPLIGERRIDGAVLVDPTLGDPFIESLQEAALPFVSIGRLLDGSSERWVDNDHASVCAAVAGHVAERGYVRPALLTIESDVSYVADYRTGFEDAFEDSHRVVVAEEFSGRAAAAAAAAALQSDDPPDVFFCIHDQLAVAVAFALEDLGLRIGREIGVLGIGDSQLMRQARVPLTSVSVFPEHFGGPTIRMLDALIRGEEHPTPVVIRSRLVARASTRRI